jgi:hypothetical protein
MYSDLTYGAWVIITLLPEVVKTLYLLGVYDHSVVIGLFAW